jgi:hypothetical protein
VRLYRDEVEGGLSGGDPESVAKARLALRELIGTVRLERGPGPGSLFAAFKMNRLALLGRRVNGSGGVTCAVPNVAQCARVEVAGAGFALSR